MNHKTIVPIIILLSSISGCKQDETQADTTQQGVKTVMKTESGLQYTINKHGPEDAREAQDGNVVAVHYTGWLDPEKTNKFDSSHDRNEPIKFPLGAGYVIKGWEEGIRGMKIGEQRSLIIPTELGYGARGAGGVIPPHATLYFDVELVGIE